ncbi:hypothetical protein H6P81_001359 [Aristolochia fimbriata]|uniref:CCHC-type domain-containing protein n=1 Tax=Aristolochia fimbriata TaxID=158543 RepID=A0AAV7F9V7_ARIFI|nr:hypothetical protein H6P81_001359 [Aristolochia fimbriata]
MKIVEKLDTEWTEEEERLSNCNSKALNAIFGVNEEQFRRISACTTAQEAWKILKVHYEGTESVRVSKLQMLTTQFELMRMREDESILEYEGKIRDIANQSAALGEKIPQNRLVRKVLQSLSSRFKMKRVAIEEYKVIDNMTLDELIGSLKTFEMNEEAEDSAEKGKKESLALQSVSTVTLVELGEKVSLLEKEFNKFTRRSKKKNYVQSNSKENSAENESTEVAAKRKVLVCFECGGKGHIQSECPTYLRKQKSFSAAWSEDESSETDEDEYSFVAFIAKIRQKLSLLSESGRLTGASSSEGETEDEVEEITLKDIIQRWDSVLECTRILKERQGILEEENTVLKKQIREMEKESKIPVDEERILRDLISSLETENLKLKQKITEKEKMILKLEEELKNSQEVFKKFDKCRLDDILIKGRSSCNKQGIGYTKNLNNKTPSRQRSSQVQVCHYCGVYGHIRPSCYKLYRDWRWSGNQTLLKPPSNCVWKKKRTSLYATNTTGKTSSDGTWYFDSGCSRHMTGNARNLTDIHREDGGEVTFGDGSKVAVIGRGSLRVDGLPKLENVLLVDGLKVNLLSISQLCDQNLHIRFTKDGCVVENDRRQSVLEGTRTGDSCYKLNVSQ